VFEIRKFQIDRFKNLECAHSQYAEKTDLTRSIEDFNNFLLVFISPASISHQTTRDARRQDCRGETPSSRVPRDGVDTNEPHPAAANIEKGSEVVANIIVL
jgi:hypothetical protein